jgi:hypothetical protein
MNAFSMDVPLTAAREQSMDRFHVFNKTIGRFGTPVPLI